MPSGHTHDRITLWTLPLVGIGTLLATASSTSTLLMAGGYLFGGLMFGPDLDIHSVQFKRWGWFRWIWIPYQGSLSHRSPLSHSPITGTALRILYLLVLLGFFTFLGLAMVNQIGQLGWSWGDIFGGMGRSLSQYRTHWFTLVIGIELGALSHILADWATTTRRRYKTEGWKAVLPKQKKTRRKSSRKRSPTPRSRRP
ncbi:MULTISPECIES: metal-binding protein [unclassified Leptolyngbya]|uniref:metal-binding protein n=1 Tax=unclassified Leptolyngbya TaxID=2650499 RepID=UPI0016822C19|nr:MULTISPECIES: metal-binding protein [unclassified Leptolyngbya]MBD1913806.1 metal-binding protein [Leptolyngbya sp. FACHB-8]MBD2153622.1 metal-binding protein [Leptolyngbya sp. FACHB-16]